MKKLVIYAFLYVTGLHNTAYAEQQVVKVAVLQFGTLNWEMDVIRHHQLDQKYNFKLEVIPVGSKNASAVALQSEAVDLIYGDWVWVNRQRNNRKKYGFSAGSASAGGIYLQPGLKTESLHDLEGLRLGIAGGAVDKSWLLLQAYNKKQFKTDISKQVTPVFAAPPLLNKLMYDGKLAASLNFWHYSARLNAKGFNPIITVSQMIKGLGINRPVPLVGWIFPEHISESKKSDINSFLLASEDARKILLNSDAEWERIRHLTHSEDESVFKALKKGYREGVVTSFTKEDVFAMSALFRILAQEGGYKLTGGASTLSSELFWVPTPNEGLKQVMGGV